MKGELAIRAPRHQAGQRAHRRGRAHQARRLWLLSKVDMIAIKLIIIMIMIRAQAGRGWHRAEQRGRRHPRLHQSGDPSRHGGR